MMKRTIFIYSIILSSFVFLSSNSPREKYWIFFVDKQGISDNREIVSKRSIERRKKVLGDDPVQQTDLPVHAGYLSKLREMGHKPVVLSKWLNAGSFYLSKSEINSIKNLHFIKEVRPVTRYIRRKPVKKINAVSAILTKVNTDQEVYGNSYNQNDLINTIPLHNAGITGKGILIGVLDTGFNLEHESLENMNVVAEYDFINKDGETMNEPGQDIYSQDSHGTAVLSAVGGYFSGALIGAAYGADFAIAKTEDNSGEFAVEEDYWVAGIEWLDSLGADVVTSSLGYNLFSDKQYALADMDGQTTVTTIAAALAAEKGIVVVNSAGNEGNNSWRIITAPADADGILAVGAVNSNGEIANFSSRGPTADGRIKPDVVAPGVSVFSAYSGFYSLYSYPDGTSMAAPLVAGSAALILSAHPELVPDKVIAALKSTADRSGNPDNTYGWGLIDSYNAATYYGPVFSNTPGVSEIPGGLEITVNILSGSALNSNNTGVYYCIESSQSFNKAEFQDPVGDEYTALIPLTGSEDNVWFFLAAEDNSGQTTRYPGWNKTSSFRYNTSSDELVMPMRNERDLELETPDNFSLSQNYPNPFGYITKFAVDMLETAYLSIKIYNVLGQQVRSIFSGDLPAGSYLFDWNGINDMGIRVGSGVYFCRMTSRGYAKTIKMVFVNTR